MVWKNQLTKTPILVLFIVLISIGVGTASALVTITLAGDVAILGFLSVDGDTTLDGDLFVDGDADFGGGFDAGHATFGNGDFNGGLTVDTDTLVVDSANDKVGVGTLTPEATIHVVGDCIGCMAFYEVSAVSLIAGLNDLSCTPGDRVISGGGWVPGSTAWIRESWAFDFDTWRLSYTDVNGNAVAPGAFKIICAELEGDNIPPLAPTLLGPADEVIIDRSQTPSILFSWASQDLPYAFCCNFTLRVLDGEGQTVFITSDEAEPILVAITNFLLNDEYFWNVKETDGAGNEGAFAPSSFSFTIVP